ncbi:hypothetical protein C8R45DRAFT_936850 [Mycena sanguinolenta]|nr:hypothetical protein C8R45DRAFT_936850 [Mycena sanguinolenta]
MWRKEEFGVLGLCMALAVAVEIGTVHGSERIGYLSVKCKEALLVEQTERFEFERGRRTPERKERVACGGDEEIYIFRSKDKSRVTGGEKIFIFGSLRKGHIGKPPAYHIPDHYTADGRSAEGKIRWSSAVVGPPATGDQLAIGKSRQGTSPITIYRWPPAASGNHCTAFNYNRLLEVKEEYRECAMLNYTINSSVYLMDYGSTRGLLRPLAQYFISTLSACLCMNHPDVAIV